VKRIRRKNRYEKLPDNSALVTRVSRWGNPYEIGKDGTREEVIAKYETWLKQKLTENPNFLEPLRGKDLVCVCHLDELCHEDIILKYFK